MVWILWIPFYALNRLELSSSVKGSGCNTFGRLVANMRDMSITTKSSNFDDAQLDSIALDASFEHLFESLLESLRDAVDREPDSLGMTFETTVLLIYTLLECNTSFRGYVFAFTEIDHLILPLLECLNRICRNQLDINSLPTSSASLYVVVIILLIFSADPFFVEIAFLHIIYDDAAGAQRDNGSPSKSTGYRPPMESSDRISWYRKVNAPNTTRRSSSGPFRSKSEHIPCPISLGNLLFVVMVDLFQYNVVNLRDSYLHQNCLAILSNLAPFCVNMHFYGAKIFVNLTKSFIRRINQKLTVYTFSCFALCV